MSDKEKKSDLPSQKALDEANAYIRRAFDILSQEATRVREEKEAFDSVSKKLKEGHFGKTIKLNVGGQHFCTSVHTLTKDPGSMLNAMFSGRFDTQPSEDGSFFIDRDGTYFRFILNYLRTGKLLVPKDELIRIREELLAEAEYYQIHGIIDELVPKVPQKFSESAILTSEHADILVSWLPPEDSELGEVVLLYRASRDGWDSGTFHSQCDNKGPTITVVKVGTYVFGGYTEQSWNPGGSGSYKVCTKAFLFSLVNSCGTPAAKMNLKLGDERVYGIYYDSTYGPTFGGGHDLMIANNANSNSNSYSELGHTYRPPPNCTNSVTFLAGKKKFVVSEFEVFGYQK